MYYVQNNVEGKTTYNDRPKLTLANRTKKLYKLLKEHKLFGIYITTVTVRPQVIQTELTWLYTSPLRQKLWDLQEAQSNRTLSPKEKNKFQKVILEAANDTISRLDEEYIINLIEYVRRYFNSSRGKNIQLM